MSQPIVCSIIGGKLLYTIRLTASKLSIEPRPLSIDLGLNPMAGDNTHNKDYLDLLLRRKERLRKRSDQHEGQSADAQGLEPYPHGSHRILVAAYWEVVRIWN